MYYVKVMSYTFLCLLQNCGWAFRFALLRMYVCPEILCVQLLLHSLMEMTVKIGFCDAARFTWVMGLCQFISKSLSTFHQLMRIYVRKFNPLHDCITIVLGKKLFMGRPCAIDTFLSPVSLQCYLTLVSWTKCKYIYFLLK